MTLPAGLRHDTIEECMQVSDYIKRRLNGLEQDAVEVSFQQKVKTWCMLTLGTILVAAGVYFFKFPNHFSTGGVSGISVILAHYFPSITPGTFVYIINMLLLLIGWITLGRDFGIHTAYVSILQSTVIFVLERVLPMSEPMTTQPLMELIFAVTLPAVGSAILFNHDASSGGTDIIAMIVQKHSTMNIGRALLCSDCIITLMACVAFGMETGLFSVLGLLIKSIIVDMVLENIHTCKCLNIVTSSPEPIEEYIIRTLNRSATRIQGEGIYTHDGKTVLMTAMSRRQAIQLRRFIRSVDPHAFILITNSSEIIGKGFTGTN